MIAVDTSVWIDLLNAKPTPQAEILRARIAERRTRIVVGDLVLVEVLQGLADEREAAAVEAALRRCLVEGMVGPVVAIKAAANYRRLRRLGISVRRTVDVLIGTFCIERGLPLLHRDRDYDHLERHLGLAVVR